MEPENQKEKGARKNIRRKGTREKEMGRASKSTSFPLPVLSYKRKVRSPKGYASPPAFVNLAMHQKGNPL
ncbi:MAG: hypothetical protein IIZ39_03060 [Blautia sp.]|nr:hypothetical protein [Blautia sp.]